MKKLILIVSVFFSVFTQSFAQNTLDSYSYVIVPEEYSFLAEKDQFQLNSMTKFLFNKNGFNAFYQSELPMVKVCDGLVAEVIEESNFTRTSLHILLKDCRGNIVFEGDAGRSKYKEYRKAYQDALRNSFKSIERLNFNQRELVLEVDNGADEEFKGIATHITAETANSVVPQNTFNQYDLDGVAYLLKKTGDNFVLFQESELADNGLLLIGEIINENGNYVCSIADKKYPMTFKSNSDIIIYMDDNLMKLKFQN